MRDFVIQQQISFEDTRVSWKKGRGGLAHTRTFRLLVFCVVVDSWQVTQLENRWIEFNIPIEK